MLYKAIIHENVNACGRTFEIKDYFGRRIIYKEFPTQLHPILVSCLRTGHVYTPFNVSDAENMNLALPM